MSENRYDVIIIGAGITRGLQQASANGLYVADCILKNC